MKIPISTTIKRCDKQTGLWEQYDAMELATPDAFARDPALVWGWYEWRRAHVLRAAPNPAHHAIAQLEKKAPQFTLVTQNVDDLHERAGSENILHLHGEVTRPYCERCRQPHTLPTDIASAAGATTIQINPKATDADGIVTHTLRGPVGTELPQVLAETWPG
jgi:NAD-dependent SIR2 family protein deacetylase